ncbi:MAG: hypothetical protein KQH83_10065 [Actinobacteria bacterium]|nr:hypothetical protein [Actinomycetota bacterium]
MSPNLRSLGAASLIAFVVLSPGYAVAAGAFDGTYTGTVTRYPEADLVEVTDATVTVTVDGSSISGTERFEALRSPDYGEYVDVVIAGTQWVEFSGEIGSDGSFTAPGLSFSSFDLRSCDGSASNCSNVEAPSGNPDGFEVEVRGRIEAGTLTAEVVWPGMTEGTYAFVAANPAYVAPAASTTTAPPPAATTVPSATTSTPAGAGPVATAPPATQQEPSGDGPAGDGVPVAAIVVGAAAVAGAGAVGTAMVRRGGRGLRPNEPSPDAPAGYGGMPGSARIVVDLLESAAVDRSEALAVWRSEGLDGLDRLARHQAALGASTGNPVIVERANAALTTLRNPDVAGLAHPPPAAGSPPLPPPTE